MVDYAVSIIYLYILKARLFEIVKNKLFWNCSINSFQNKKGLSIKKCVF